MTHATEIDRAAAAVREADALLVTAGAGMGVDSGLPDFRGPEGFWKAYPKLKHLGVRFEEMANPAWFHKQPEMAWGFYGHRLALYRETEPHAGFALLKTWGEGKRRGCFVFTSNVDGQFHKADYDPACIVQCHGSIHRLQCREPCSAAVWPADERDLKIDLTELWAHGELPTCPKCGQIARPNILMFWDMNWVSAETRAESQRYATWLEGLSGARLAIVECGAGESVPTVRYESENTAARYAGTLIRINPREPQGPPGTISLRCGALEGLTAIAARL